MFIHPSRNALAGSCKKRSFFLAPLQDLARYCKILRDPAGSCGILQESCRILAQNPCKNPARFLQNPTRSCRILQDFARSCRGARKKDLFLQDLARAFLLGCSLVALCHYNICTTDASMAKLCIKHLFICCGYG